MYTLDRKMCTGETIHKLDYFSLLLLKSLELEVEYAYFAAQIDRFLCLLCGEWALGGTGSSNCSLLSSLHSSIFSKANCSCTEIVQVVSPEFQSSFLIFIYFIKLLTS